MKLITLNIWGGHVHGPLLEFIANHRDTDIFCFQEVYHNATQMITVEERKVSLNIFSELQTLLPHHRGYFRPVVDNVFGICTFVNKSIEVIDEGDFTIYVNPNYQGKGPAHSRILQWLKCRIHQQDYVILNVHGLWNGMGKTDTEHRLLQSEKIRAFMDTFQGRKILCGDFNLRPDTESLKMLEKDMNNLVQAYQVSSTRTSYYPKAEKFADYILTSPDVAIKTFQVLKDEVSDHSPLMLDFS